MSQQTASQSTPGNTSTTSSSGERSNHTTSATRSTKTARPVTRTTVTRPKEPARSSRSSLLWTHGPGREVPAAIQGTKGGRKIRPLTRPHRLGRLVPHGDGNLRPQRPASRPILTTRDGGNAPAVDQQATKRQPP